MVSSQENILVLRMYAPRNRGSKYGGQKLRSARKKWANSLRKLESSILFFSVIDTSSRQKIHKDLVELNRIINQLDLIDRYRTFSSKNSRIHNLLKLLWNIHQKRPIRGYKAHFNTFKRIRITKSKNSPELSWKSITETWKSQIPGNQTKHFYSNIWVQ